MLPALLWISAAFAADPLSGKLAAGQTPATVFAHSALTAVGDVTAGQKTFAVQCGTLQGVKTCAVTSNGKEIARSTNIVVHTGNATFSIVFDAGDGFAWPRITWE